MNSAKSLPYPLKQGLKYVYGVIPLHIHYGKVFRETYALLQKSQWWSKEQLEEYQLEQLSKLLQHAYENVPYYRRVFDKNRIGTKRID
jgi:phenylacetate-CoA ligase